MENKKEKLRDLKIIHLLHLTRIIKLTKAEATQHWQKMLEMKNKECLKINDGSFEEKLNKIREDLRRKKNINFYKIKKELHESKKN